MATIEKLQSERKMVMSKTIVLIAIVPLLILLISCENSTKSDRPPFSKERLAVLSEVRKSLNQPGRAYTIVSAQDNKLKAV